MVRSFVFVAFLLPLFLAGGASAVPAADGTVSTTTFVLRGRGWGHGVGMGLWGAYGQAKRGVGYAKILGHYYPGTRLAKAPSAPVRVLLRDGIGPFGIASPVPFRVEDGDGATYDLEPGSYPVGKSLRLALAAGQAPEALPGPLTFRAGSEPLTLARRPYRGQLQVQRVGRRLQVVNIVSIDAYVRGVVSEEVPDDWPVEAVKAQAVAARSYALSQVKDGSTLYADTRSQVYGGIAAESKGGDAAVAATRREILKYDGKVATTFFYSSSGGRTAAVTDVFSTPDPIPYLVAVPDPDDKYSPYHRWGPVVFTSKRVSHALGIAGAMDLRTVPASGRARQVVVTGRDGEKTIVASAVRTARGLRSTWITPGVLSLSRPSGAFAPGAQVELTGVARKVKGPVILEQREQGGSWTQGPDLSVNGDGSFLVEVTPAVTTFYRLAAADDVASAPLRVPVTPTRRAAGITEQGGASPNALLTASFLPNDPLASLQWYLAATRAFDFWTAQPVLDPVPVAIIDTGIDRGHPEFAGRISAAKSFVGGTADDPIGHGTFVAGLIAATTGNAAGIAGIALPAQLLVARVASSDGEIDTDVEAKAIRWAADRGARVINLSLGGLRDPLHGYRDTFSRSEADAVAYAWRKGAVVVAAVGNGDAAPRSPWPYASYPAALPHVIGVSAVGQSGAVPSFSNRDAVFNDLAAPGEGIVSTLPRSLTASKPSCLDQGYSTCGPRDFRDGNGTSFAAAMVSAAAALLIAVRPELAPEQVAALLERTTSDMSPATGCARCTVGRDARSGWGSLDILAALQALSGRPPLRDRYETNDDAGPRAAKLWGSSIRAEATLDFWDDQIDVYEVYLQKGQRAVLTLRGPGGTQTNLVLWRPGTQHVEGLSPDIQTRRIAVAATPGANERIDRRAETTGWHYVEVKMGSAGSGRYTLRIDKRR
jgi:stage II sporulation protein D